jgi:hypothetical protein
LHILKARLSTALAYDFNDLEEQLRRRIGRIFLPALLLKQEVNECA